MSITRVPQLLEQAIKSNIGGTNPEVRNQLEIYSRAEVDAEINSIDLTPYATNTTVANISAGLDTRLDVVEANYASITLVGSISGALITDIENLDLSLTQKIDVDCMQSEGVSGMLSQPVSGCLVTGYLEITINGVSYRVGLV